MSEEKMLGQFLKDVSGHAIKILQDNGIYRHIRFAAPGEVSQ